GQELALRAACSLRGLFGTGGLADCTLQFPVGVAEIVGALRDLLFEELAVPFQPGVPVPDLREHLVEAVDERSDLILRAPLDAKAVVLLQRDALHGVRQVYDGT